MEDMADILNFKIYKEERFINLTFHILFLSMD